MKRINLKVMFVLSVILGMANFHVSALELPETPASTSITSSSTIEEIRAELDDMEVYVLDLKLDEGKVPTFDVVEHPEGCSGTSITNNEYVTGQLTITYKGDLVYDSGEYVKKSSGMKIKMRGNTSTANPNIPKKSYKIKLEKKADLLFSDGEEDIRDKEWLLLGYASEKLHYIAGFQLGRELGLGWQPNMRHVAVIMNDEYIGSYYLAEAIAGAKHRVDIDDSGYIVENDAYWWKPEEAYFKSLRQLYNVGWTFKAPDEDDFDEMTVENIKWVINSAEQAVYTDKDTETMVDYESLAKWLLAHDIMNTVDPIGSNLYLIKKNFSTLNPFETKLTMGPLWDLDDSFKVAGENFALIHSFREFWFFKLTEIPAFWDIYVRNWEDIRTTLKSAVMEKVENYLVENPDLHKLSMIDSNRRLLTREPENPYEKYEYLNSWFDTRIPVLNKLILGEESSVVENFGITVNGNVGNAKVPAGAYKIDGTSASEDTKGVVISVDEAGKVLKSIR